MVKEMQIPIHKAIYAAGHWLLQQQNLQVGGWSDRAGRSDASTLNTAEVIAALLDSGVIHPSHTAVRNGLEYLRNRQLREGAERGAWYRRVHQRDGSEQKVPDIVRTSFVIQAFIRAGHGTTDRATHEALDWLRGMQNSDHGWPYRRESQSTIMPTCFALQALLDAYGSCANPHGHQDENSTALNLKGIIELAIEYLISAHSNKNGSYGRDVTLQAIHSTYATLVLQQARSLHFRIDIEQEKRGLTWLLRNPDKAKRLVEEQILIFNDTPNHCGNYSFLFFTDALLIRVLMNSVDTKLANSALAQETLIDLKDRIDEESGGIFGNRVFTWSTAKSLTALTLALKSHTNFPIRPPETVGIKAGEWIVGGYALLLSIFILFLTVREQFTLTHAGLFVFLMLVMLLAYRFIGAMTFADLVCKIPFQGKK